MPRGCTAAAAADNWSVEDRGKGDGFADHMSVGTWLVQCKTSCCEHSQCCKAVDLSSEVG